MTTDTMICRECRQPVETYRTIGSPNRVRADGHTRPSADAPNGREFCPGSFHEVDDETTVQRETERTYRWRHDGGPSLTEYLRSKGEM